MIDAGKRFARTSVSELRPHLIARGRIARIINEMSTAHDARASELCMRYDSFETFVTGKRPRGYRVDAALRQEDYRK